MKISFLAAVGAIGLFSASALHAQTTTTTIVKQRRQTVTRNTPPAVSVAPRTGGVVPRAIRSGSPLQMINPLAPASYGSGSETVRRELNDPYGRAQGIKLVSIEF